MSDVERSLRFFAALQLRVRIFHLLTLIMATIVTGSTASADDAALFEQRVAPILQRRCVSCHNDADRQGDLSFQSEQSLRAGGESGAVVQPGDPQSSLLLEYIQGSDPEMPKDGKPLSADEVAAIRAWIAAGARWPSELELKDTSLADTKWWSLEPIQRPQLPELEEHALRQARTPIDCFILAKLGDHGLRMSPEADRRTLIRRVYFDLIGLPPTPAQVESFVLDRSPTAYEDLVDRLLASPHYGERWGRHWLDVVKYADTCGYDKDKLRTNAWPYRDYVIRSFNQDKPYRRFVHEQLAGDLFFPGTPDGVLGLGFVAAGPWDFIGHVEVPESKIDGRIARHIDRDEMMTNTLNTFTSATIQCARCHNHKFDPFTQQHYYRLQAVFAAVDRAERPYDLDPAVEQQRRELNDSRQTAERELAQLEQTIKQAAGPELSDAEQQIQQLQPRAAPHDKQPAFGYHSQIEPRPDRSKWVQVDLGQPVAIAEVVLRPCHDEFAGIGAGFGFPVRFKVETSDDPAFNTSGQQDAISLLDDQTRNDFANPGLAPHLIRVEGVTARYVRVTATRLVERQNDFILALAELQVIDAMGHNAALHGKVSSPDSIEAPVRWARSNLTDGIWARPDDEQAAVELAAARRQRRAILDRVNTPERVAARKQLRQQIEDASGRLKGLPQGRMVYAAATDFQPQGNFQPTRGTPRTVRVLHRGNILEPGATVKPGTLPVGPTADGELGLSPDHSEADARAALARWITHDEHPLTWRSIANRIWQYHFGKGIVETPNDFGRMGQLPSHPELLDWLAAEFRDHGQSIKRLHRWIVTSAVYRQASTYNAEYARVDANNQFLWRANRRRLEAEAIRDAILAVSGQLDQRMGGPGYYLFVLEKTDHSPHYEYHKFDPLDRRSHRRTVYRFIVRSQPDPYMTTLDCADSSQSTPRRNETLTALQALSLLNNKFNLAMSRQMAARLAAEHDALPAQVQRAMQLLTGRRPTADEQQQLEAYAQSHGPANLCRVLFNLSEFVYLD